PYTGLRRPPSRSPGPPRGRPPPRDPCTMTRRQKARAGRLAVEAMEDRTVPVLAVASSGSGLAQFDTGATGVVTSVPITGLQAGETIVGLDVRPATQQIYGVGSTSRLYTLDPLTGAATQVGTAGAFTLNGTAFGVDFNPVPDRIRVVSNTEQ